MASIATSPLLLTTEDTAPDIDTELEPDEQLLRRARSVELGDPTGLCCAVVHAAVESFHGARPVRQLARHMAPRVFEQLSRRALAHVQLQRASGVSLPLRTRSGTRATARILRARVVRVSAVAAEATVIVQDGERVRAAALRVEEFRGRWQVTVLQIG